MKRKIFKISFLMALIFTMLLQTPIFAEAQLPYIEVWHEGTAYTLSNSVISNCIAYDYLSDDTDKFVKLDANGKETARASDPDMLADNSGQENGTGTVTIAITMPDKIDNAVDIVLCDESGREVSLTAYKDNNYIAYVNIPPGTYTMCSAGIRNDYKGEYPAKWDTDQVILEPSGAAKVNITISGKQDLTDPDTYKNINVSGNYDNISDDKENQFVSPSPAIDDNMSVPIININYKSLVLSTILTAFCLALLLLCYKLVVWRKEYKKSRKDDNE